MNSDPIHILSLGAGVQSSTLALMAAAGEVTPMPVAAIFADTQAEPASVYKWLDWLEKQLPFPVLRVTAGSLTEDSITQKTNRKTGKPYYSNMIPAFVKTQRGHEEALGITGRHCTYDYKITPILRAIRKLAGVKRGQKHVSVIQWIGISLDEVTRMKPSREKWSEHRWPLIDLRMNRHDCLRWMESHGLPKPPRSACTYCPFHGDAGWRRLRDNEPEEFAIAVKFEKQLQACHSGVVTKGKMKGVPFLHSSCQPLDTVDFSTDEDHGQQVMFQNECEGMCGV